MPWESNPGNVSRTQCFVTLLCSVTCSSQAILFILLLKLDQIIDIVYCLLNTGQDTCVASKSNLMENL